MRSFLITLLLFSSTSWSNLTQEQVEKLKTKTQISYEDLAHENLGCPENSICSKEMGLKMRNWEQFIKDANKSPNAHKKLEKFRAKHGIPVSFLTKKSSVLALDPILFSSRCAQHNPKDNKEATVYKAIQFFRNNPNSDTVMFDSAWLEDKTLFKLPYEELPIMVKDKALVVVREYQSHFYHLAINPDGQWRVIRPTKRELTKARQVLENAQCEESDKTPGPNHLKTFCKTIWNTDLKKAQTIRLSWACH